MVHLVHFFHQKETYMFEITKDWEQILVSGFQIIYDI